MLVDWKAEQDEMKEILGDEYMDYKLKLNGGDSVTKKVTDIFTE